MAEKIYKSIEVANGLCVNQGTISQWVQRGVLGGYYEERGSRKFIRIPESALNEFLESNPKYKDIWFNPVIKGMSRELKAYIDEKCKVLKELQIKLTPNQYNHLWSRKSEFEVDSFAHDLIMGRSRIV